MVKRVVILSGLLIVIGILLTQFYLSIRNQFDIIEFEDSALESAIRDVINNPDDIITRNQVESITTLDLPNLGIENLSGIEALSNLRILNLESNHIQDVTPLRNLRNLESLNLRNNGITDLDSINLSELSGLTALKELNLRHNVVRPDPNNPSVNIRISDISILAQFRQLESLILRDNHIENIGPLEMLPNLRFLDLSQNPIVQKDLDPLKTLYRLEHLNLRETNINNIEILQNFSALTYLNLHSNTDITSLEPLSTLFQLETLILRNVPVGNQIEHLENLHKLTRLNLRNTGITDLSVLAILMENGALLDNPSIGQYAELDLRNNPIEIVGSNSDEGYNPIAPYWNQITYRNPYILPANPTREVVINEYMSSNGQTITDYDGDTTDWIELYNTTQGIVDLSGYYLSDDTNNPFRWQFPEGTQIDANGHLLIFASGKDMIAPNGELHTNFGISRSGEPLIITAPNRTTLVDQVVPVAVPRNISYGRFPDGSDNWEYFDQNNITPNASNNSATPYNLPDWLTQDIPNITIRKLTEPTESNFPIFIQKPLKSRFSPS